MELIVNKAQWALVKTETGCDSPADVFSNVSRLPLDLSVFIFPIYRAFYLRDDLSMSNSTSWSILRWAVTQLKIGYPI